MTDLGRSYLSKRDPAPTFLPEDVELRFEDWATNVDWFRPDGIDWVGNGSQLVKGITNWSRNFGTRLTSLHKLMMPRL